jgi:hypothetical protein
MVEPYRKEQDGVFTSNRVVRVQVIAARANFFHVVFIIHVIKHIFHNFLQIQNRRERFQSHSSAHQINNKTLFFEQTCNYTHAQASDGSFVLARSEYRVRDEREIQKNSFSFFFFSFRRPFLFTVVATIVQLDDSQSHNTFVLVLLDNHIFVCCSFCSLLTRRTTRRRRSRTFRVVHDGQDYKPRATSYYNTSCTIVLVY